MGHPEIPNDPWAICAGGGKLQAKGSKCSWLLAARLARLKNLCGRLDAAFPSVFVDLHTYQERRYARNSLWACATAADAGIEDCTKGRARLAASAYRDACAALSWVPPGFRRPLLDTLHTTAQRHVP